MRQVFYRVTASLDGYIAGPRGEVDWIRGGAPEELAATFKAVDTVLLGRRTYELTSQPGAPKWPRGWNIIVGSRSLPAGQQPAITVTRDPIATVSDLRAGAGRPIWLFGGGSLFRSLLDAKQVDIVEVVVIPVLLGGGIPLLETGGSSTRLTLVRAQPHPAGAVTLRYEVLKG